MAVEEEKVIRFYDPELNFLKEVDDYTAFIYRSKWNSYGAFELYMDRRLPCVQKDNIIIWNYDTRKNGIIKYIECSDENGVIVKGYSLLYLLKNRIAVPPAGEDHDMLEGSYEDCMYALVDHNAIIPADISRKMPLWERKKSLGRGGNCRYQARYKELPECLTEMSKVSFLGIGVDIDLERKRYIFEVLEGTDRTIHQSINSRAVFSDAQDNVYDREYILNDADSRNCAYVAGQGEGAGREIVIVGNGHTGNERKEVFIDARDVEDAVHLSERGNTKLAGMVPAESYSTQVDAFGYQKKWDLGDFVTVFDEEYHITMIEQVIEVEEDMGESGYSVIPTFGIPEKSISEKMSDSGSGESYGGGGASDLTYIHTQMTAASVWKIEHNLSKFPSVSVVDSAGSVVVGECTYVDKDNIKLVFSSAFAGYAYLN